MYLQYVIDPDETDQWSDRSLRNSSDHKAWAVLYATHSDPFGHNFIHSVFIYGAFPALWITR